MKKKNWLVLLSSLFFASRLVAQLSEPAMPYSISNKLKPVDKYEIITGFDQKKALADSAAFHSRLKGRKFAQMLSSNIHPYQYGQWNEVENGRVWRVGICSPNAYSLYLVFGTYHLLPGVKLFVYRPNLSAAAGAFSSKNNNRSNSLTVAPLAGDSLIIEMDIPDDIDRFGELVLTRIGHDFVNEFGLTKKAAMSEKGSDSCMIDINCSLGSNWQNEKRAVCKLLANGLLCTGSLINTVDGRNNKYLLTAYHCIDTFESANGAVFYFNYEKKKCNGTYPSDPPSISGSELIASGTGQLDFALVRLSQAPPVMWKPYLAGWDASGDAPQSATCIHHPNGDVKKISVDYDALSTGSFGEGFNNDSHWIVNQWDVGSTQGGSSGSPIFNNMHRICGTLTGGEADCANPIYDYFNKFSLAWNANADTFKQLKHWLDPQGTNTAIIDGRELYALDSLSFDTLSNTIGDNLELGQDGLTWGNYSSQNSAGFSQFAEKYSVTSESKVAGMYLNVVYNFPPNIYSYITVKVWSGHPYPQNEVYSQTVYQSWLQSIALNFIYFDSLVTVSDTFFVGYELQYTSDSAGTFAVYNVEGRNMPKLSMAYVYSGSWFNINEVTQPPLNTSFAMGPIICQGTATKTNNKLKMGPNPCTSFTVITLPNNIIVRRLEFHDLSGRTLSPDYERVGDKIYLNTSTLPGGVIIVSIVSQLFIYSEKLVVLKN
jgi:hypothetical protein